MAVEDGGGEYSSVTRKSPSAGTMFLQPPFPVCPSQANGSDRFAVAHVLLLP